MCEINPHFKRFYGDTGSMVNSVLIFDVGIRVNILSPAFVPVSVTVSLFLFCSMFVIRTFSFFFLCLLRGMCSILFPHSKMFFPLPIPFPLSKDVLHYSIC